MKKNDKAMIREIGSVIVEDILKVIEDLETIQKKYEKKEAKKRAKKEAKQPTYQDFMGEAIKNLSAAEDFLEFGDLHDSVS